MKAWKKTRQAAYKKRKPWVRFVEWARRRCNCTDPEQWFPNYGAKGIICDLTAPQLEIVWRRDRADLMKRPSLDRINPLGNYTFDNVRFIEFNFNSRLAWDKAVQDTMTPEFT